MIGSSSPKPSAKTMEEAAEQYAFYVHEAKTAESKNEALIKKNDELVMKNSDLETSIKKGSSALLDLQVTIKESEKQIKAFEDRESPKLEAMKEEAMKKLAEQREHEAVITKREEALAGRELDSKRTELQVRAGVEELATMKADLDSRERMLAEREHMLSVRVETAGKKEAAVLAREESQNVREGQIEGKVKQLQSGQNELAKGLNEVNALKSEIGIQQSLIDDAKEGIKTKELLLKPLLGLAKEFKQVAVQYAGDAPKVTAWLEAHCVE